MDKINDLDKINNLLITYAYSRCEEIRDYADKIRDSIIEKQPSSIVPNSPLNVTVYVQAIQDNCKLLEELEEASTKVYRVNKGLDQFE